MLISVGSLGDAIDYITLGRTQMKKLYLTLCSISLFATITSMTIFVKPASANSTGVFTTEEIEASLANLDTPKDCMANLTQDEEKIALLRECNQIQMPEILDLMKPVTDSRLLKCVPDLERVNSLASNIGDTMNKASSNLSGAEIGNEGKHELSGISYNIPGKEIKIEGVIRARHLFGEFKEQIPVPVTRYKDVPYPVTKYRKEQVPVAGFETKRFKECLIPKPFGGCAK